MKIDPTSKKTIARTDVTHDVQTDGHDSPKILESKAEAP